MSFLFDTVLRQEYDNCIRMYAHAHTQKRLIVSTMAVKIYEAEGKAGIRGASPLLTFFPLSMGQHWTL